MSVRQRLFAGKPLRTLRERRGLRQVEMAATLGISASYLSQLENDERHLTPALTDGLRAAFPLDWADLAPTGGDALTAALHEALAGGVHAWGRVGLRQLSGMVNDFFFSILSFLSFFFASLRLFSHPLFFLLAV